MTTRNGTDADAPRASVVVCTRDRQETLSRCLSSLQKLGTDFRYEIVVVDNSETGTARDVAGSAGVRYVHEPQRGLSRARNTGVRESSGEVVAFIDDDAVADSAWLSSLVRECSSVDVGGAAGVITPPPGELDLATFSVPFRQAVDRSTPHWFERTAFGGIGNGPNIGFRRDALQAIGGFDERLGLGAPIAGSEEHDVFLRLVASGLKVVSTPEAVVEHRSESTDRVARAMSQRRASAAYIVFLMLARREVRWRAVRYALEALFSKRRRWRLTDGPAVLTPAQSARAILGALPVVIRALRRR